MSALSLILATYVWYTLSAAWQAPQEAEQAAGQPAGIRALDALQDMVRQRDRLSGHHRLGMYVRPERTAMSWPMPTWRMAHANTWLGGAWPMPMWRMARL